MTRRTNARIAGFTFLFYIATGISSLVLSRGTGGADTAARLAIISQQSLTTRLTVLLTLLQVFCAIVLAVTLYGITRDEDPDIAMLGLTCRVAEGVFGAISIPLTLGVLWLATATGTNAPDAASAQALAAFTLRLRGWNPTVTATFFAVGSLAFCWLLLRGRLIPVSLAWLGVIASILLVVALPLSVAGFLTGPAAQLVWLPMAAFEIPFGFWLIIKGVATPRAR